MRRPAPIHISIPQPCSQSWDEMTPAEGGRHCAHCSKTVIDFTGWSDAALYRFLQGNRGQVCGRFLGEQLDRPIAIPPQPHSRLYRLTMALGLTLLFTQIPDLLARQRPPVVACDVKQLGASEELIVEPDSAGVGGICGIVVDDRKEPMLNAAVLLYKDSVQVGGVITDYEGNYHLDSLLPGKYKLVARYAGYDELIISEVVVRHNQMTRLNLFFKPGSMHVLGELRHVVHYKVPLVDHDNPTKRTITKEEVTHMPY